MQAHYLMPESIAFNSRKILFEHTLWIRLVTRGDPAILARHRKHNQ